MQWKTGLAGFAPQDPAAAAKEMERAIIALKLNGSSVNFVPASNRIPVA
jgi:hypothetical protein